MIKAIKFEYHGNIYFFLFNGYAMFSIEDLTNGESIFDFISKPGKEGFDNLCTVAAILSEQGKNAREYHGFPSCAYLKKEELLINCLPFEHGQLMKAVSSAILLGYGRDVKDDNEVVDLYAAEIQAQKKTD